MDTGIPNTSTKSTREIAVVQPNDEKPNEQNVNSDTAVSQLVHTGRMCSEKSERCSLNQLPLSLFFRVTKSIRWSHKSFFRDSQRLFKLNKTPGGAG